MVQESSRSKKAYKIRKNSLCCYKDIGQIEQFGCHKKKYKPYKKYKRKFKNDKKFKKGNFKPHKKYFKKKIGIKTLNQEILKNVDVSSVMKNDTLPLNILKRKIDKI